MRTTGIISREIGSAIYGYAVITKEGSFIIENDNDLLPNDLGKTAIVDFNPGDPFCKYIAFYSEQKAS